MWKKIVALLTVCFLIWGMLSGCQPKSNETKKEKKGRYVEKEIAFPEEAKQPVDILWENDTLVLYSYEEETGTYESYRYMDGSWTEAETENWLAGQTTGEEQRVSRIFLGGDGNVYAQKFYISEEGTEQFFLLKKEDDTAKDVTPEFSGGISDVEVLKNGTIAVGTYSGEVAFYKDGTLAESVDAMRPESPDSQILSVSESTIAVFLDDEKSIAFYDAETLEKKKEIETEQSTVDGALAAGENGDWYLVNKKGIHRLTEDGSIVETIMDGTGNYMSNETQWFEKTFLAGGDARFYALYSGNKGEYKLMQYLFDKEAAAVQEETLTIYSLQENRTVAQAVHAFQSSHPDVKVEYHSAVGADENPTSEHIRTLNTELLGGSGADVLILDGLPIESYIEKGVLADLSDLKQTLEQSGVLPNVIENTAQKDGKVYGVPARIGVPVIFGSEAEVKACESLEALEAYARQNPKQELFGWHSDYELIGMTLFHWFYEDLQEEDKSLNEATLTQLLTVWKQICENSGAELSTDDSLWTKLNSAFCSAQEVWGQKQYVNLIELKGMNSCMDVYGSARKIGVLPESIKQYYVPKAIAGINASSKQQELAKEFVACLFSEEVQKLDTYDGFSVLSSVLDGLTDYVDSEEAKEYSMGIMTTDPKSGEELQESLTYPTREEMEDLVAMIRELKTPFLQDQVIEETVLTELINCASGKSSPEAAAKAVCQKVDTYLSE